MHTFNLKIDEVSKIEGKGSLVVKVKDGRITDFKFSITEYKRFYTKAIEGKDILALPQLCARICGTCSNAHLICALKAVEDAIKLTPSKQTVKLRELVNYGLNIRDHALHLYVFVLPDMLGIDNILELDENIPSQHELLDDVFTVKRAGNLLGREIGGRSVHAPFLAVGGFTKLPNQTNFGEIIKELQKARISVLRLIKIFYDSDFELKRDINFVSLVDNQYSFLKGDILVSDKTRIGEKDYGKYLEKVVIPYSQATGFKFKGKLHMIGALARMNLNKSNLHKRTKEDAKEALKFFPSQNIFHNNLAQAIEILHSIDQSVDILSTLKLKDEKIPIIQRKEGIGIGVIEAPRGTLYYKLEIDDSGKVIKGDIVVPTGQNQIGIEQSLYQYIDSNLTKDKQVLLSEAEKIIRAYDPCMSCASHFLKVKWS